MPLVRHPRNAQRLLWFTPAAALVPVLAGRHQRAHSRHPATHGDNLSQLPTSHCSSVAMTCSKDGITEYLEHCTEAIIAQHEIQYR